MKHVAVAILPVLVLGTGAVRASDLDLRLSVGGAYDQIVVCPGDTIPFEIEASITNVSNLGLAGIAIDLTFDGGDLTQVTADGTTMANFLSGFTGAEGFGGRTTAPGRDGDLVQIGGAQNTINNASGTPSGSVDSSVALSGLALIASGTLTAPTDVGIYTLSIPAWSVFANVIKTGETGPMFLTEAAPLDTTNSRLSIAITVSDTGPDAPSKRHVVWRPAGHPISRHQSPKEAPLEGV